MIKYLVIIKKGYILLMKTWKKTISLISFAALAGGALLVFLLL
jgi:hypothetical protein